MSHPAQRPAEPDHPLVLDGGVAPGDVALMARCMIEELLQVGVPARQLMDMSRDPNYQALIAARHALGDARMDLVIDHALLRVGQHRVRTVEHPGVVQPATLTIGATS